MAGRPKKEAPTGFGGRLKSLREAAGMTQDTLAEAAGVTRFGIMKLEQNTREPSWPTVLKLAEALGVGVEEFAPGGPGSPPPELIDERKIAEIAERFGVTARDLNRAARLLRDGPPEVERAVHEGKMTLDQAEELVAKRGRKGPG